MEVDSERARRFAEWTVTDYLLAQMVELQHDHLMAFLKVNTPSKKWVDPPPFHIPRPGEEKRVAAPRQVETDPNRIAAFFGGGRRRRRR